MVTLTGGDRLEAYLADLAKKVSNASTLNVGFPEGATYPDGTSVAMVAAINEFGAPSRGIPPRPFVREGTIAKHKDEWGPQVGEALKASGMDARKALQGMGEIITGEMQEAIVDFTDPRNAPSTIKRKGFDDPLVDTGQMLRSVTPWIE